MMLRLFKKYNRDERGILAVDFIMTLPLMLLWMFASVTVFDGFVKYNKMVKATATVANLIGRLETTTNEELDNIFWLYRAIAGTKSGDSSIRVTSVRQDGDDAVVHWSYAAGNKTEVMNGDAALDGVPELVAGDYIMLLETFRDYEPLVEIGVFPATTFRISQPFVMRFTGKLENVDIDTGLTDDQSDGSIEDQTVPPGS